MKNSTGYIPFDFNIKDINYKVRSNEYKGCSNNCELISVYDDKGIIDILGSRCGKYTKTVS